MAEEKKEETGGIGNKCEYPSNMAAFVTITGGSREQRLRDRNYSKTAHAVGPTDDTPPLLDISMVHRIF